MPITDIFQLHIEDKMYKSKIYDFHNSSQQLLWILFKNTYVFQ